MTGAHAADGDDERSPHRTAPPVPARPDASMVLLDEVMRRPLDPGYAEAAARKAAGIERRRSPAGWVRVLVIAVLLGYATTAATIELRAPQPDVLAARSLLEQEIEDRRETVEEQSARVDELTREIDQLQSEALSDTFPSLLAQLERDSVSAGQVAVTGPGLVVTLRDSAQLAESPDDPALRVQDYDIQVVVNSLWSAGAEAVAVNGQRLTTTSAIRSAGDAILVDLVGLSGPYEIAAIGDPATLPTYFSRSQGQQHLTILGSRYGIGTSVSTSDDLHLRAGRSSQLFTATVPQDLGSNQVQSAPPDDSVSGGLDGNPTVQDPSKERVQ